MIYLQEVFDNLARSKFSNMSVGRSVIDSIQEAQYPKVISLINSGLYDIYFRLVMLRKEFNLHQRAGYTTYYLRPDNVGDPDCGDPDVYIDGTTPNCIDGDIIKLLEAYDADGEVIRINNSKYPDDLFYDSHDTLKIIERDPLEVISIVYQASHPLITIDNTFDPATYELNFPRHIMKALLLYVASEWFVGKTAKAIEGEQNLATSFRYQYETEMLRLEQGNFDITIENEPEQFTNNGWV